MKRIFFSFLFFIIFTSCSNKINPPKWYINPPVTQDNNVLYGTGEGLTKNSAINYALNQIAAQIHTSINSEVYISKSQNQHNQKINFSKTIEQTITQKIENFNIYNYKILKLKKIKNIYFVLASVNKNQLANIIYKKNKDKLNNLKIFFKNSDYFHKFKIAKQNINLLQKELIPSLYISYFLGKKDALNIIKEAQDYTIFLNKFINNFTIAIKSKNYNNILYDLLTQKGININSNASLKIYFQCNKGKIKYSEYYIIKLNCNINIKNKHNLLFSQSIKSTGKSLLNYEISQSLAIINLKNKLKKIFATLF